MEPQQAPQQSSADADLAGRARHGDAGAFEELALRYRAALVALAFARTGDREEAEDLAQDVLLRAWSGIGALASAEAFPGWLRTIAINACRDWHRRSRPWPRSLAAAVDCPASSSRPIEIVLERERHRVLRRALATLPIDSQRALLMHVWGGYSYAEIATFLGVPVTTVEGRIFRAKRAMRRLMGRGEWTGGPPRCWKLEEDRS